MVDRVEHPDRPLDVLANPVLVDGERLPNRHAPLLGADTDAILTGIGYTPADIARLRAAGTI
jgi:crotonobetainyl-CoA:carnitine CoA-transferase CaiB-like acyl-CoA transferase